MRFYLNLIIFVATAALPTLGWSTESVPKNLPPLPSSNIDSKSYAFTLEQSRSHCSSRACEWWHDYVFASTLLTSDTKSACLLLNSLSENRDFTLVAFADIKLAQFCPQDASTAPLLLYKISTYIEKEKPPKWIQFELKKSAALTAQKAGLPEFADLTLEAASLTRSKSAKSIILQSALEVLLKAKDPKAAQVQKELFIVSPRLQPVPNDWWPVGMDAMSAHDFELAVKAFEKVTRQKSTAPAIRRLAFENLKVSYKALQKRVEAFHVTERRWLWDQALFKAKRPASDQAKNLLSSALALARFHWTEHRSSKASALLTKVEKLLKNKIPLGELYFVRGRIDEEHGKFDKALTWMKKAIEQATDGTQKSQYQWNFAWLNYKLKNYEAAKSAWEESLKTETDSGKRAQQSFWLAKTLKALNKEDDAKALLMKIPQEDPLSYYTLLSYRELGIKIPKLSADTSTLTPSIKRILASFSDDTKRLDWNVFDWLISTGENKWARQLLDDQASISEAIVQNDKTLLSRYVQSFYFAPVFSTVAKLTPSEKQNFLSQYPQYLFPKVYMDHVARASVRSGLWPEYILSIMRQESSFDTTAVSPANAYGLLQLLPGIAKNLAREKHINYKNTDDLLDPATNIELGAFHLRNYWNEFDSQFILTTAAYNASPQTVKSWVKTRYHGDPLIFIEDIPYDETRTYVRLVLRNFIQYLRLSTEEGAISFPEWCLDGIHVIKD